MLKYREGLTGYQARRKTISLMRILSSKVALKWPSGRANARLICPRTPDTVRIAAPSNFAISRAEVNISRMKAVFLNIFTGVPVNFSFLTISLDLSTLRTTPVAATLNPGALEDRVWKAQKPVLTSMSGP